MLQEWAAIPENQAQVRAARITTLGNIPLIVLAHDHMDLFPPGIAVAPELIGQEKRVWRQMQCEMAGLSPQGRLVIDAIQQVVLAAR